jgi:hypothetical protein
MHVCCKKKNVPSTINSKIRSLYSGDGSLDLDLRSADQTMKVALHWPSLSRRPLDQSQKYSINQRSYLVDVSLCREDHKTLYVVVHDRPNLKAMCGGSN